MKYSIVTKQKLNNESRLDAEYFSPEAIENDKMLMALPHKTVEQLGINVVSGPFGSSLKSEAYLSEGVPFIRISNLSDFYINEYDLIFISDEDNKRLKSSQLNIGDLVLSKVGNTIGVVSKVDSNTGPCNISENNLGVKFPKNFTEEQKNYILTFLNSKNGQIQILRRLSGNGQPKLNVSDILGLYIPKFNESTESLISFCVEKVGFLINKTKKIYKESQNILLQELGILNWQPKHELSYVKNFSDVSISNRYDAEYFQPKYGEIIEKIKSYPNGWDTVENILEINDKNITPKDNEEYRYIELSNISNNGEITGATIDIGKNLPTRARRFVEAGELIVSSIEGSLDSIALVTAEYSKSFCSNGFYVLKSDFYNSETLLCLLKSIIGQMQLKKGCSGTILTAISKEELNKIILPKISIDIQNQVKDNIQKMYKLKYQSKQLLEIAKRGVEIAIEENEEVATSWINEQLSKIGVEL